MCGNELPLRVCYLFTMAVAIIVLGYLLIHPTSVACPVHKKGKDELKGSSDKCVGELSVRIESLCMVGRLGIGGQ